MLAALRGVLRECWHAGLISTDDYQATISSWWWWRPRLETRADN